MALAQAIEPLERKAAEDRKRAAQFGAHGGGNISTTDETGKVRDIIAQKLGLGSGKTLEAAQKVVERDIPELVEAMDRGKLPNLGQRWAQKSRLKAGFLVCSGGRYWDRTSDFHRVKVALYR